MSDMIKIGLLAYEISPYRGSEAAVSWNYVVRMKKFVKITVFYGRFEEDLQKFLIGEDMENVEFVHVPSPDLTGVHGVLGDLKHYLLYKKWHRDAARKINEYVDSGKLDIIHYLNPIGFKEPGAAWKIKGVPYVWGPLQGVDNRPLRLIWGLDKKLFVKSIIRTILHNGCFIFSPSVRRAFRRSNVLFAATPATQRGLAKWHGVTAEYMPEHGLIGVNRTVPVTYESGETFRMVWAGSLIERKAPKLLIEALLKLQCENWRLDVVGDGPLKGAIADAMSQFGDKVEMHGRVSHAEAQYLIQNAHLHLITSLGEASTTVLFEAMGGCVPTLTLDHCGMSGVVTAQTGVKIPLASLSKVTSDIAAAIDDIVMVHPERIEMMSISIADDVKRLGWDNRCQTFLAAYRKALQQVRAH